MPDSATLTDSELYEADFYLWTQVQAAKLRQLEQERTNLNVDLPHLAEEIEDLGGELRNAIRSHLRRVIEHCLKLEYSPAERPRAGWRETIIDARAEISDRMTPTISRHIRDDLPRLYEQARRRAEASLIAYRENAVARTLPAESPYCVDELLMDGWYPTNKHGLND